MRAKTLPPIVLFALLPALLLVLVACDSSSSPTAAGRVLVLTQAAVSVDGQAYGGGTYSAGVRPGTSTVFEAHLVHLDGTPVPGERVWVEHRHGGGMVGGHRFELHDDGSRGDPIAGDGIYCFEDQPGTYGFHHHPQPGDHHYDFWGVHHGGGTSNRQRVTVRVVG